VCILTFSRSISINDQSHIHNLKSRSLHGLDYEQILFKWNISDEYRVLATLSEITKIGLHT
jgi:hypothetical protein